VDEFIHARSDRAISTTEWIAAIPPANVNDNFIVEEPDMLAELAEALAEPEEMGDELVAISTQKPAFSRAELLAMRAELLAARDALSMLLPRAAAAH
jgi:hypothetical protein